MPQSFGSLHCHIVFSTKRRQPLIAPEALPRLFEYLGGILRNHSSPLIAAGGMPDHVHLLVSLARTVSVADILRVVKANSSGWMHEEMSQPNFLWQEGYGAFAGFQGFVPLAIDDHHFVVGDRRISHRMAAVNSPGRSPRYRGRN